jgi:nitroimidazol reductase NimA-like FMN-containing flavoprotein (pyridoxamine 5'-phosphate oxidase superfamily)
LQAETIEKKLLWIDYKEAKEEHAECKDILKKQQVGRLACWSCYAYATSFPLRG